ncbi:hypothetical protein [Vagococcus fluvialis]|uniref:hypothetical protein n=1 Tax=Vagococcus fluvialis TaxID=2738 RepID=UPI001A8D1FE4|nr:hypothetical protein [Vagococcus fluvialis]MBO0437444.1 hypothetical protein [Vagococcus fluvialis]
METKNYLNNREDELENQLVLFKKTLNYKQLTQNEKKISCDILEKLSEFMFVFYKRNNIEEWQTEEIKDVLLNIFPEKILANSVFFESIYIVCFKFFESLLVNNLLVNCKEWLFMLSDIRLDIAEKHEQVISQSRSEQLFLELGTDMGLNMSSLKDVSKLYKFYNLYVAENRRANFEVI